MSRVGVAVLDQQVLSLQLDGLSWNEDDGGERCFSPGTFLEITTELWPRDGSGIAAAPEATHVRLPQWPVSVGPDTPVGQIDFTRVMQAHQVLTQPWPPCASFGELPPLPWHPSTLSTLNTVAHGFAPDPVSVTFYTDGSFKTELCQENPAGAWSVVMVQTNRDSRLYLAGFLSGVLWCASSVWPAEQKALEVASLWAVQRQTHIREVPCAFAFDSSSSGAAAAGQAVVQNRAYEGHMTRYVMQVLEAGQPIAFRHVPAHTGNPFNEMCDTLANFARAQVLPSAQHPDILLRSLHEFQPEMPWVWMYEAIVHQGTIQYPRINPDTHCMDVHRLCSVPSMPAYVKHAGWNEGGCPTGNVETSACVLHVASANVKSLAGGNFRSEGDGFREGSRLESLLAQFRKQECHLVGVQETRTRHTQTRLFDGWFLIRAKAEDGLGAPGGIDLWVDTRRPFFLGPDMTPAYFIPDHFCVLVSEPRKMIVKVDVGAFQVLIIVAHCPHQLAGSAKYRRFWAEVCQVCNKHDAWPKLLLVDANATLGQQESDFIGPHQSEPDNPLSSIFHDSLKALQVALPSTFAQHQDGPGFTYTSPFRTHKRIDFVGVSVGTLGHPQLRTRVLYEVDLTISAPDHEAVFAAVPLAASTRQRASARPVFDFARPVLQQERGNDQWAEFLGQQIEQQREELSTCWVGS